MKQEQQKKNAGFSLIEVVLSMAILAIISIPLLNYFSESLKYNAMMAAKQKATLLAQEIAEEIKEQEQFIQNPGTGYSVPYLLNQHYQINYNALNADGIGEIQLKGAADDLGKNYDVVVTAKADTTAGDASSSVAYGIDNTTDILAADAEQDEEALVYFKAVNSSYCSANEGVVKLTTAQIQGATERVIHVDIQSDGSGYCVNIRYEYSCSGLRGDSSVDTMESVVLVDERITELKNIYLLYHLLQQQDKIEITKGAGVMISPDLYLACQNLSSAPSGYQIRVKNLDTGIVHTNVGTEGNAGSVVDDSTGLLVSNIRKLTEEIKTVRMVKFQVAVYKKGEADVTGSEPYITVDATKGE